MSYVFLLFGASRGIGAACARALFARGATVCLTGRDANRLEVVRQHTGPSAAAYVTDIIDPDSVQATVDEVLDHYGKIDTVINFAAQTGPLNRPTWDVAPTDLEAVLRSNVVGTHNIIRSCVPPIQKAGRGTLFFASSPFGDTPQPGVGVYAASRAAGNSLVHQLAAELDGTDVGAALVYPGMTDTEGLADFRRARGPAAMGAQVSSPAEMAQLFVWAAMQSPRDINGQVLSWANPHVANAVQAMG